MRTYDVETIYEKEGTLKESYVIEKFFLKTFEKYKYEPKIPFKGKGECFNINPLILYNNIEGCEYQDRIQKDRLICEENGINYEQQFNKY
jgi:hypothetical protein